MLPAARARSRVSPSKKPEKRLAHLRQYWGHCTIKWIATGFGLGTVPVAPGTAGTLAGIPLYLLLRDLAPLVYAVLVLGLFLAGAWICGIAERELGRHDAPAIVYDEIVGYLVTMFLAPAGWTWIVAGFVLFRLFDVWKPFPAQWLERLPGGWGTMADDAMAGVYALAALQAIAWLGRPG